MRLFYSQFFKKRKCKNLKEIADTPPKQLFFFLLLISFSMLGYGRSSVCI